MFLEQQVECALLKARKPAMSSPPFPGGLGELIQSRISQEAWEIWLEQQTQLINEHKLDLSLSADRLWIMDVMRSFLLDEQ